MYWRVEGSLLELTTVRPMAFFTWNAQTFSERWLRRGSVLLIALLRPALYLLNRAFATRVAHTVLRGVSRDRLDLLGEEYFKYELEPYLKPDGVKKLKELVDAGATVPAIGVVRGAEGGGLVACCANTLVESITPRINQQLFFITQPIRELISGSVNIRHLPGRSSPSLIFPIWTRCNRFTVTRCDSNSRRTSWYLP